MSRESGQSAEVLTVREFAGRVGISYGTAARAVRLGEVPAVRVLGAKRVLWGEFLQRARIKPKWAK